MSVPSVLIVGGTGDVGRGVVDAALQRGWEVTVVGRDNGRLEMLRADLPAIATVRGDTGSEDGVAALAGSLDLEDLDAIIVAVNAPWTMQPLLGSPYAGVGAHLEDYLRPHVLCASGLIPLMKDGSTFVGIGGGMADAVFPGLGGVSMAQAAQRMAYRHLAKEARAHAVRVREVMIHSMVAGASNRGSADPAWLTAEEIGASVCDAILDTEDRRDPLIELRPER